MSNQTYSKAHNQTHHYPVPHKKKHHYQKRHQRPRQLQGPTNIFQGNLVDGMRFGGKDHTISGFVMRKVVVIDKEGNKQIAKETQFFNSGKNIGRIKAYDNEGEF